MQQEKSSVLLGHFASVQLDDRIGCKEVAERLKHRLMVQLPPMIDPELLMRFRMTSATDRLRPGVSVAEDA